MYRNFRGKCISDGSWVFGSYVLSKEDYTAEPVHAIFTKENDHVCSGEYKDYGWYEIEPDTLGQYTGVGDIYEGDLVLAKIVGGPHVGFKWPVMPVVFDEGAFCLKKHNGESIPIRSFAPTVVFDIVGNIYDQPQKEG